ncbi:MAG: hypothetical protein QXG00_03305 [Candidatus Woesearchaeota archaeon]
MNGVVYFHTEIISDSNNFYYQFESCQVQTKTIIIDAIQEVQDISLPLSLFSNKESSLRLIVKYLIEEKKLSITKTAELLNRNVQTVWCTYKAVKNKKIYFLDDDFIPLSIFWERKLSVLESLVYYLNQYYNLSKISRLLLKNPRTIWTIKQRALKKLAEVK